MKRVRAGVCAATLAVTLLAGACTGPDGEEDLQTPATPTQTATSEDPAENATPDGDPTEGEPPEDELPEDIATVVEERQDRLTSSPWYRVAGTVDSAEGRQRIDVEGQRQPEAYRGLIEVEHEGRDVTLELLRVSRTTWLRADPDYWRSLGYDEDSVRRSEGRYVVFEVTEGDALWARHDPTAVLRYLVDLEPADLVLDGRDEDGVRVRVADEAAGEAETLLWVPFDDGEPVRLVLDSGDMSTELEIAEVDDDPGIRYPPADEVVQPQD